MPRLPVLFFAPVPDFKGGAERSLMDLMDNPGVEPFLAVPAEGPLSRRAAELNIPFDVVEFGSVSTIRRPFRLRDGFAAGIDFWRAAHRLKQVAAARNVALVHSNGLKAHAIAIAARRLGGKPAVIHIRDIANTTIEAMTWKAFQASSNRTILVSRACWPRPALPANTHVVYNGFAVPDEPTPARVDSNVTIGFAGRIHPAKGLHTLLDALALARRQQPELRLIVRGSFASETPAYEGEIRQQISRLDLTNAVSVEGFVSDPEAVYRDIDIMCVPSTTPDPLPRSVMEAMGRGLPVVATRSGGIPEMIIDSETGFLADNAEALAAALAKLAADPALRQRTGDRARQRCLDMFTLPKLHQEVSRVYALATGGSA